MSRIGAPFLLPRGGNAAGRQGRTAHRRSGTCLTAKGCDWPRNGLNRCMVGTALDWIGKPGPHAWQRETSLFSRWIWTPAETKKARFVVASSCVPRGVRGSPVASGCRSLFGIRRLAPPQGTTTAIPVHPWRPSSLLSGCPPTGTRPQARAKLGKAGDRDKGRHMQEKYARESEKKLLCKKADFSLAG